MLNLNVIKSRVNNIGNVIRNYSIKNKLSNFSIGLNRNNCIDHKYTDSNSSFYTIGKFNFTKRGSSEYMNRHKKDIYVKKSKALDYRSRAAFKLIEIHQKYKLLRAGQKVLDVGSAPGGWSQVIAELTKSNEKSPGVVAVDLLGMESVPGVHFIQGDMTKQDVQDQILLHNNYEKFDLVLSDMCPEFTGTKSTDHYNLINLNNITVDFASKVLKRNGSLIIKTFEGTLQKRLQEDIKKYFNRINRFKPASSRQESSEMFLVCLGYLENEQLKKEADEITKMSPEEYFEKQKNEALKVYRLAKLNELTLLEELDKLKEEIKQKFKVDPDKIKVDPKEEQELKKIIEEENLKLHTELYGRAYKPIKAKSMGEFVSDYQKEMKFYDEKIKDLLKKEKIDLDELNEFMKEDADQAHMKQITAESIKEIEFFQQKVEALEKQIKSEEVDELLRPDGKHNEILSKYKRWEGLIQDLEARHKEESAMNPGDEINIERHSDNLQRDEDTYLNSVQNEKKKMKKVTKKRSDNIPDNEDVFWEKDKSRGVNK